MRELKPCPFCGKAVTIADYGSYLCIIAKGTDPNTSCRCRLFMESEQFSADDEEARQRAKERLIEKWNRRFDGWHTGTPTESGEYLVCIRYDFGKEGYTTANYVEPYNPHTGWYNLKPPSVEDGHEWCKKNGIEVIAWQKIEPFGEKDL